MAEEKNYIPLSERLNQDVWHDNFVPKYSAIGSAQPSRVVLVGVWLIFAPMAVGALVVWPRAVQQAPDPVTTVIASLGPALMFALAVTILTQQTRRYLRARREGDAEE